MWRYVVGFVLGFLMAAALGPAAPAPKVGEGPTLQRWGGEGARTGLYYAPLERSGVTGTFRFFECRELPPVNVRPPGPQP